MSASTSDLRALLAGEVTSLYQNNPFRLLNIASNASVSQAQKRARKLAVMRAQGERAPDEIAIGEALQVLREPRRRLLAELFWFHTDGEDAPDSPNAAALNKLKNADWQGARALWREQYQSDRSGESGRRALHNLAVLEHARVVTLEAGANPLYKRMTGNAPLDAAMCDSWQGALRMWSDYLSDKSAWHHWRTRVVEMGDKRLGPAFVGELREMLPETLLQINRDIARRYADAGWGMAAGSHCALMRASGFNSQDALAQSRSVLDPIKKRVQTRCEEFDTRLNADPKDVDKLVGDLQRAIKTDLALLNQIDPQREMGASNARDTAAKSLHRAGWKWPNKRAFPAILSVWNHAHNLAISPVLRADIADSIDRFEKLKQLWRLAPATCICCRQAPTNWHGFTQRNTGVSRVAFVCDTHHDEAYSEVLNRAVDNKWASLPLEPKF